MTDRERRLQEYLDRKLEPSESEAFEKETLASAPMSEELMDELALRDLLARRRRRARRHSPLRRVAAAAVGMVAAAALLLLWPRSEVPEPVLRSDDASTIEAVQPVGRLDQAPTKFEWAEFEGANSYRIEVFDENGGSVIERTVSGTSYTPDDSFSPPRRGYWSVTALDSVGLEVGQSGPIRFEITETQE